MSGISASYAQNMAAVSGATPKEQEQSDLTKILQDLNTQESGRADYQNQQETAFGVDEKTKTVNDLQSQLQTILNEHAAAQLQTQQGQGVTTGIDNRQRDEETRLSAIKALSLNSLISAANGNLTYAQSQADKAVKTKFDPIEAKITANTANLNLIKNDPETSREEKARADAQLAIQTQMKAAVDQAKQNSSDILKIAIEAASNRADSVTLQNIQNAQTPMQALQVAGKFMVAPTKASAGGGNTGAGTGTAQGTYQAGQLTQLLQSQGKPTDEASLSALYKQIGGQGTYTNDTTHNSQIYNSLTGQTTSTPIQTLNGKPLNDTQATALGYAQRMNDANQIITELGSKFTGISSYVSGSSFFPNILKSDERQNYEQAQRNFINAILRKESGAAISPTEFDSAAKQYFPQPGDSQSVIDQKTANRTRVIANLAQSANVSLETVTGAQNTSGGDYSAYLKAIGQ